MVSGEKAEGFTNRLKHGKPFKAPFYLQKDIPVYGVSHPGNWGCRNVDGESNMLKSWQIIAEEFKKM